MSKDKNPHVVVVGAGFGGLWATKYLARKNMNMTLIDQNNYHTFLPLIYQVASSELDPGDIAYPIRQILRKYKTVQFHKGRVTEVDFKQNKLSTDNGHTVDYDYLVLANGSADFYFGIPGAEEHCYPLKNLDHAIELRNHILCSFEAGIYEEDPVTREKLFTFVIAGGGPTGVEFVGALSELIKGAIHKDYHEINGYKVRVVLIEALPRVLNHLPEDLSDYTLKRLKKMGVEVLTDTAVKEVSADGVTLASGEFIPSNTVVWTAGVAAPAEVANWEVTKVRRNRIEVTDTMQTKEYENVFVIGDLSFVEANTPPMVAPTATQQADVAAQNIVNLIEGKPLKKFVYKDLGSMAVIGRNAAVAYLFNRWKFTGFIAWFMWLGVHLIRLIGFRNRLVVLMNWAWNYLFYNRAIRLILQA